MRFRTLEIRWHDSKPISTCDFQPVSFKKARPAVGQENSFAAQSYRLATGGEDNHVRVSLTAWIGNGARCSDDIVLEFEDMDGTPEYYAGGTRGERLDVNFGRSGGRSFAQTAESRVSCYTQPTFSCCECCALLSEWYVISSVFRALI
jgi:hypothetical protein